MAGETELWFGYIWNMQACYKRNVACGLHDLVVYADT